MTTDVIIYSLRIWQSLLQTSKTYLKLNILTQFSLFVCYYVCLFPCFSRNLGARASFSRYTFVHVQIRCSPRLTINNITICARMHQAFFVPSQSSNVHVTRSRKKHLTGLFLNGNVPWKLITTTKSLSRHALIIFMINFNSQRKDQIQ